MLTDEQIIQGWRIRAAGASWRTVSVKLGKGLDEVKRSMWNRYREHRNRFQREERKLIFRKRLRRLKRADIERRDRRSATETNAHAFF